jgi:hypothetical protein
LENLPRQRIAAYIFQSFPTLYFRFRALPDEGFAKRTGDFRGSFAFFIFRAGDSRGF